MGTLMSRFSQWWSPSKPFRIVMLGLDAAGKTTILYRLKLGEATIAAIPTIGFNVETISYGGISFCMWDCGGGDKIRPLFRHYFPGTDAFIYVVDTVDRDRLSEAANEFGWMVKDEQLKDAKVLILANKSDLPDGLTTTEIAEALQMSSLPQEWNIQATCGTTGEGLEEALKWLHDALQKKT